MDAGLLLHQPKHRAEIADPAGVDHLGIGEQPGALCARAQVHKTRFRDLRHTYASLLHEQGADARMITEFLGHSSIRMTVGDYTFVRLDSQRSAFDHVD
ncbi:tyrosine-type recombinase/integrase [Streptomyces sp. NPDC057579]|uniref:tyrosine-type recombinase/integrase n=1 Tax=Streptomyces sp. NPDC057579 TaxID=3346172 RepID=UPI0036B330BD